MNQYYGMTAEMYQSVKALVDERVNDMLSRHNYDRLAEGQERLGERMDRVEAALERLVDAQARTESRVGQLAQAQARTEERVEQLTEVQARTEERVDRLAEVQERILERLDRVEATVERLVEAQERTEKRVEELAQAQSRTEERLNDLIEVVSEMRDTQGAIKGSVLELTYQRRVGAYFGPLLRRVHTVSPIEIEDELETHLSPEEFRDLLLVDLVVSGYPRHLSDAPQVWLAVEISGVVDRHDVERARQRAEHLVKAGYAALPAVAGEDVTKGAEEVAQKAGVLMVLDGWTGGWEQALEQLLTKM